MPLMSNVSRHLTHMRIYADFNGLQRSSRTHGRQAVPLDTYGSLCDLAYAGIALSEGVRLTIYDQSDEHEDLQASAIVFFDLALKCWVAEIEDDGIQEVQSQNSQRSPLVCLSCRASLEELVASQGLNAGTVCSQCGAPAWLPILPPPAIGGASNGG